MLWYIRHGRAKHGIVWMRVKVLRTFKLTGSPNKLGFFIAASFNELEPEVFFASGCLCEGFVGDVFSASMEIGSPRSVGLDWDFW